MPAGKTPQDYKGERGGKLKGTTRYGGGGKGKRVLELVTAQPSPDEGRGKKRNSFDTKTVLKRNGGENPGKKKKKILRMICRT